MMTKNNNYDDGCDDDEGHRGELAPDEVEGGGVGSIGGRRSAGKR